MDMVADFGLSVNRSPKVTEGFGVSQVGGRLDPKEKRPLPGSAPAGAPTVPVFTRRALGDYTPGARILYHKAQDRRTNFGNLSYAGRHLMILPCG